MARSRRVATATSPKKTRRGVAKTHAGANVELIYFVVCDEVRIEAQTNKGIFLGVFNGVVIGAADPVVVDRMTFVFAFRHASTYKPTAATMTFSGPAADALPSVTFDISNAADANSSIVMAEVRKVRLPTGVYSVALIVDGEWELRGRFDVRADASLMAQRKLM